jgi:hypothetical protein
MDPALAAVAAAVAAACKPDLEVECEWGKAERPAPSLPASMLCGVEPGSLATGASLESLLTASPSQLGPVCSPSVVVATCQVGCAPNMSCGEAVGFGCQHWLGMLLQHLCYL